MSKYSHEMVALMEWFDRALVEWREDHGDARLPALVMIDVAVRFILDAEGPEAARRAVVGIKEGLEDDIKFAASKTEHSTDA